MRYDQQFSALRCEYTFTSLSLSHSLSQSQGELVYQYLSHLFFYLSTFLGEEERGEATEEKHKLL